MKRRCSVKAEALVINDCARAVYGEVGVCTPFPSGLFGSGESKDFEALRSCLASLPSLAVLGDGPAWRQLSTQQLLLLRWLATHPRCPTSRFSRVALEDVKRRLPNRSGWVSDIVHNPSLRPQCIIQLVPNSALDVEGRVLAFHGTHFENVHSILHLGLLNLSGTRLERTGAAFGKGIYFSTELTVAFAFCQPGVTWRGSALGGRQRCLFVCGIDKQHVRLDGDTKAPDRYLVVDRPDAVTLYYAFLYSDDASAAMLEERAGAPYPELPPALPPQQRWRVPTLALLYLAFVLVLLSVGLREHWPLVRRLCRRHLGIRLP
ncbi:hypothetical protein N2152v2_000569 [Parachlorella kessleri]